MTGIYVYGFVDAPLASITVAGHTIEVVQVEGLRAAIERVATPPELTEEALQRQHAIVQRLARRADAIVPTRFGAFVGEGELREIVRLRGAALRETLDHVRGRVQMTARVLEPAPSVGREAAGRARPSSGTAYLLERKAGATGAHAELVATITMAVRSMLRDQRVDARDMSGHVAIAHLIARADVRRYRGCLAAIERASPGRFTVTGPWAPFVFAPELWP